MSDQPTDSMSPDEYLDFNTIYKGEITYEEDDTVIVVRTVDAGEDGFLIMVETEEGGAIVDLIPDAEEAVARTKELVEAFAKNEGPISLD